MQGWERAEWNLLCQGCGRVPGVAAGEVHPSGTATAWEASGQPGAARRCDGSMTNAGAGPEALRRLALYRERAGAAERRVIDVVCRDPAHVLIMTAGEIAHLSGVSEATVARVWQKAGFTGFEDMRAQLARDLGEAVTAIHEEITPDDDPGTILHKVFQSNAVALTDTLATVPPQAVSEAVALLERADTVLVCGVGNSGLLAEDAQQKWLRVGLRVYAATDTAAQAVHAALLGPSDVVVALSHSGTSRSVWETVQVARGRGAKVIAITRRTASPLSERADVVLPTAARETAFRSEAMSSRLCMLSIVDSLFVALAMRRRALTLENLQRIRAAMSMKHVPEVRRRSRRGTRMVRDRSLDARGESR